MNGKKSKGKNRYRAEDEYAATCEATGASFSRVYQEENETTYHDSTDITKGQIELTKLNAGKIGGLIGTGESASRNITFIIITFIFTIYIGMLIFKSEFTNEYWKYATSTIALSMGYLFGRKQ